MRRRRAVVLRREDHKRDGLGAIFLGAVGSDESLVELVSQYFGPSVKVLFVETHPDYLRTEIETTAFVEESRNLVAIGSELLEKGRTRAAGDMFAEALRLDPMNPEALKSEARRLLIEGDLAGAESRWILAGELSGFDAETLRGLAAAALEQGRRPSAMRYLEEAISADPTDRASKDLLEQMRKQIELRFDRS